VRGKGASGGIETVQRWAPDLSVINTAVGSDGELGVTTTSDATGNVAGMGERASIEQDMPQ
jgi:hypothetical protein